MSSQRILGHMVTRNEADRYLPAALRWLSRCTDGIVVFDDRSTDDTVSIAEGLGCAVAVRDVELPSFLQDESACRQAGWEQLALLDPDPNDWVLCVDADEFLVAAPDSDERDTLLSVVARAFDYHNEAVAFPKPEVFGFDHDGTPLVRTDGWWAKIAETRLVRWAPGGEFRPARLAGGSIPAYGLNNRCDDARLHLLHLGYARRADQIDKHSRYTGLPGHSNRHVQSILTKPALARWQGKVPGITGLDG